MSYIQVVMNYASRLEAESAKSLLEMQGIMSIVEGDDCGGIRPDLSFATGGYKLLVKESDLGRAKELLG